MLYYLNMRFSTFFLILYLPPRTAYMQNTKPANTGKLLQGYNIQCYLFVTVKDLHIIC